MWAIEASLRRATLQGSAGPRDAAGQHGIAVFLCGDPDGFLRHCGVRCGLVVVTSCERKCESFDLPSY